MSAEPVVTITPKGRRTEMARRLPYEIIEGDPATAMRSRWHEATGFVVFLDAAEASRAIGPLLGEAGPQHAVVVVDEAERRAVPLTTGAAVELAHDVAIALDVRSAVPSLRDVEGFTAEGDVIGVEQAMLEGRAPLVIKTLDWPTPLTVALGGRGPERLGISDELIPISDGVALLRPPSLVVGMEVLDTATATGIDDLLIDTLANAGLSRSSVAFVALAAGTALEGLVAHLRRPVQPVDTDLLRHSQAPFRCEAAALQLAGKTGRMVVSRRNNEHGSVAIVRRLRP